MTALKKILVFILSFPSEPYLLIMEYVMYGKMLTHLREQRMRQSSFFNFSKGEDPSLAIFHPIQKSCLFFAAHFTFFPQMVARQEKR